MVMPLKMMSSEKLSGIGFEVRPSSEMRPPRRTMSKARRMASGWPPFRGSRRRRGLPFFRRRWRARRLWRVEGVIGVHFCCQLAAVFVDFDGEDGGCADGSRDCNREQADGAAAGDGHGFGGDFSGEDGVHALPRGSRMDAYSCGMAGSSFQIFDSGMTTYSAKAPLVSTR